MCETFVLIVFAYKNLHCKTVYRVLTKIFLETFSACFVERSKQKRNAALSAP